MQQNNYGTLPRIIGHLGKVTPATPAVYKYPRILPILSSFTQHELVHPAFLNHPDLLTVSIFLSPILDPLLEQTEYATLRRRARRSSAFRKLTTQPHPVFTLDTTHHAMAPRVTRAAARAAATVEICVDEIDVVHVIDVKDEMIPGEKDEVEER